MAHYDPDSDPRSPVFKRRLIWGGVLAVVLLAGLMAFLGGTPDPQRGESFPNAAPEATEGMAR